MISSGHQLSAPNLLLVDDNDDVREITALLLRDTGYGVIEASSGIAALAELDGNPAIELLIVDFSMPGMSGIELLERARAKRPEIKACLSPATSITRGSTASSPTKSWSRSHSRWPSSRPRCARHWANPRFEPLGRSGPLGDVWPPGAGHELGPAPSDLQSAFCASLSQQLCAAHSQHKLCIDALPPRCASFKRPEKPSIGRDASRPPPNS